MMTHTLADLALESEAATALALRLAAACDRAESDPREAALKRIGVAAAKFWVCKRGSTLTGEAMECLGGSGYVEESIMPRLYREAPVNSIWEGSGNVQALDIFRVLSREPATAEALFSEIEQAHGSDPRLDAATVHLRRELADTAHVEVRARRVVELIALTLQGSLLARYAPAPVADAFIASRLGGDWGHTLGTLPPGVDAHAIVERARPRVD